MSAAKNRFNVQVVYPDGCIQGIEDRKDVELTAAQVCARLQQFIDEVRDTLERDGACGQSRFARLHPDGVCRHQGTKHDAAGNIDCPLMRTKEKKGRAK